MPRPKSRDVPQRFEEVEQEDALMFGPDEPGASEEKGSRFLILRCDLCVPSLSVPYPHLNVLLFLRSCTCPTYDNARWLYRNPSPIHKFIKQFQNKN